MKKTGQQRRSPVPFPLDLTLKRKSALELSQANRISEGRKKETHQKGTWHPQSFAALERGNAYTVF